MKVTREMLHKDLQPSAVYWPQMMVKYLFRRRWTVKVIGAFISILPKSKLPDTVDIEERYLPTSDGEAEIRVRIYRPKSMTGKLPPMLYTHGGGYVGGNPNVFDASIIKFAETRPCVIVAPAYRTALIKPYPAAFDDCYMTMLWMRDNAEELGIDASKFIIGGHSAGGGLTAAVTLKARDTKDVDVAFQMPFYPMIDDQQPNDPARHMDSPVWDNKTNAFGWSSYLKDLHESNAEIPSYAAPIRNTDYTDFPPTITFVGEYEPFYWETIEYVDRLKAAGVETVFKIYEKCTHGPEMAGPDSGLGADCFAFTYDNFADFYDRYVVKS